MKSHSRVFEKVILVFLGFIFGIVFEITLSLLSSDFVSFLEDMVPEIVGIIITIGIIDRLYRRYEDERLKHRLIQHLGSQVNTVAISAAEELWTYKWWFDGSLADAQLERADLRGVDLGKSNLTGARISHPKYGTVTFDETSIMPDEQNWTPATDLRKFTDPQHGNYWQGHGLRARNLRGHFFAYANLHCADMRESDLRDANFRGADLRGAQLQGSKLKGAVFTEAIMDSETILPDGKFWCAGESMRNYI